MNPPKMDDFFCWKTLIKMDDLGLYPYFLETPISNISMSPFHVAHLWKIPLDLLVESTQDNFSLKDQQLVFLNHDFCTTSHNFRLRCSCVGVG